MPVKESHIACPNPPNSFVFGSINVIVPMPEVESFTQMPVLYFPSSAQYFGVTLKFNSLLFRFMVNFISLFLHVEDPIVKASSGFSRFESSFWLK